VTGGKPIAVLLQAMSGKNLIVYYLCIKKRNYPLAPAQCRFVIIAVISLPYTHEHACMVIISILKVFLKSLVSQCPRKTVDVTGGKPITAKGIAIIFEYLTTVTTL
jgi:hypothetical protein